jgi:hypothetical protein
LFETQKKIALTGISSGLSDSHKVGKLFGVYLLNSCPAMLPIIYTWNSANTSGYTKRAMRNAMTLIAFCIGNLIGPQMFQTKDEPGYNPAKIALIVTMSMVVVFALLLQQLVVWENRKRDQENETGAVSIENYEFMDFTDIENRKFRYVY